MSIQHLIPKHKDDFSSLTELQKCSAGELKSIAPELLHWIQDGNWPIAGPIALILSKIVNELSDELLLVLKGNDPSWKYYCIYGLILRAKEKLHDQPLVDQLIQLANHPSTLNKLEEVDVAAREVLHSGIAPKSEA